MSDDVDIKGLDKAEVLRALYNQSKPQGLGILHYRPEDMTVKEAGELLKEWTRFDYLHGRVMKVKLEGDSFNASLYDRDNGPGRAEEIVKGLRQEKSLVKELDLGESVKSRKPEGGGSIRG